MVELPATETPDEVIVAAAPARAVKVTGTDRATYLDAVLSQQLADLPVGAVRGWLELDPHGAPRAVGDVAVLPDQLLLVVDEGLVDEVVERLGGRTFLSDAAFEPDERTVLAVRGPEADRVVADALGHAPDDEAVVEVDGATLVRTAAGIDVVTPDPERERTRLIASGARGCDAVELEQWRIRAGIPRWGHEIGPPHLPEELGLLPTHVHLAKGCYPGQEAVARMWMLGRPRRQLARVAVDGELAAGWEAGAGRARTTLTSIGDGHGLAFVPTDAGVGTRIEGDGGAVEVVAIVGSDRPVRGHDPAVTRRRDRVTG